MKKVRVIISLVLCCLMLMTSGCSDDSSSGGGNSSNSNLSNTSSGKGKYIEEDVTPNEDIQCLTKMPDGTLVAFTSGLAQRYDSANGGATWTKTEGPGANNENLANASNVAVSEDGSYFVVLSDYEAGTMEIKKLDSDGNEIDFSVSGFEGEQASNCNLNDIFTLSDNRLLIWYTSFNMDSEGNTSDFTSNCAVYDSETGDIVFDIAGTDEYGYVSTDYNQLYFMDYIGSVSVRSLDNGDETQKYAIGDDSDFAMSNQIAVSENGDVYLVNNKAISKIDSDGNVQELISNGAFISSAYIMSFYADKDESFTIMFMDDSGYKIYHYYYDANATTDPAKTLKIWTLEDNNLLRSIANGYTSSNPDVTIDIEVGRDSDSAMEDSDIIKNLNTEILAGDGPDIIVLDKLLSENYISNGILTDLTNIIDTDGVYDEILSSIKTNDKLYYIPARIKLPLFASTDDIVSKTTTLEEFTGQVVAGNDIKVAETENDLFSAIPKEEQPFCTFLTFEEVFNLLWSSSANATQNSSGIDKDSLETFLDNLKQICDKYNLKLAEESEDTAMGTIMIGGSADDILEGSIVEYTSDKSLSYGATGGSLTSIALLQKEDTVYRLFPGLSEGSYQPTIAMGINSNSSKTQLAADFLQNILSDSSQSVMGSGLPITQTAYELQYNDIKKDIEDNLEEGEFASEITFDLNEIVKSLKTPTFIDETVKGIVSDSAYEYVSGKVDLNTAISNIETAASNYIAEKK